jgi:TonB family protein
MKYYLLLFILLCKLNACYIPSEGASDSKYFKATNYEAEVNGKFEKVKLAKKPSPVGDDLDFLRAIYKEISYPLEARSFGVQGSVYIRVVLDEEGKLLESEVSQSLGYGCDEEALTAVNRAFSVTAFHPGIYKGKPVKVRFEIPVKFKFI